MNESNPIELEPCVCMNSIRVYIDSIEIPVRQRPASQIAEKTSVASPPSAIISFFAYDCIDIYLLQLRIIIGHQKTRFDQLKRVRERMRKMVIVGRLSI